MCVSYFHLYVLKIMARKHLTELWTLLLVLFSSYSGSHQLRLVKGSYENISVAISSDVNATDCSVLLRNLQDAFNHASYLLYKATSNKVRFGSATILLPRNWDLEFCEDFLAYNVTTGSGLEGGWADADFRITNDHPLASLWPWTQQFGLCGVGGKTVFFPADLLSHQTNGQHLNYLIGRIIVHEWARYRYGVFEETGYTDDNYFSTTYLMGTSYEEYLTSCTNPLLISLQNITDTMLSELSSSVMFPTFIPNIKYFCDKSSHVPFAPTQQNLICSLKSTSEIIEDHSDMKHVEGENLLDDTWDVNLKVVQSLAPGYLIILEYSSAMDEENRNIYTSMALSQFVNYPADDATLAVVIFYEDYAKTKFVPTVLQDSNSRFHYVSAVSNPDVWVYGDGSTYNKSCSWTQCGMRLGMELMKEHPAEWRILLVTTTAPSDSTLAEMKFDRSSDLLPPVTTITFQGTGNGALARYSQVGNFFALPEEGSNSSVLTAVIFGDILVQLVETTENVTIRKIEEVVCYNLMCQQVIELPKLPTAATLMVMAMIDNAVIRDFSLTNPSNFLYKGHSLESNQHFVIGFSNLGLLPCNYQEGKWTITLQLSDSNNELVNTYLDFKVDITDTDDDQISARVWTNTANVSNPVVEPIVIYADVRDPSHRPVSDAVVVAEIYRPSDVNNVISLSLHDNGDAAPDVTRGDGIYSAYFANLAEAGLYYTRVVVVGTTDTEVLLEMKRPSSILVVDYGAIGTWVPCCGSSVQAKSSIKSKHDFLFWSNGASFYLTTNCTGLDVYPPGRVTDLKISSSLDVQEINEDSFGENITLTWTAAGNDFNEGVAANYTFFCGSDVNHVSEDQCPFDASHITPAPGGTTQTAQLNIIKGTGPGQYYVAMHTIDDEGHESDLSNMAYFIVNGTSDDTTTPSVINPTNDDGGLTSTEIYVITGVSAFILLLIILVIILLICYYKKHPKEAPATTKPQMYNIYVTNAVIRDENGRIRVVAEDGHVVNTERTTQIRSGNNQPEYEEDYNILRIPQRNAGQQDRRITFTEPRSTDINNVQAVPSFNETDSFADTRSDWSDSFESFSEDGTPVITEPTQLFRRGLSNPVLYNLPSNYDDHPVCPVPPRQAPPPPPRSKPPPLPPRMPLQSRQSVQSNPIYSQPEVVNVRPFVSNGSERSTDVKDSRNISYV